MSIPKIHESDEEIFTETGRDQSNSPGPCVRVAKQLQQLLCEKVDVINPYWYSPRWPKRAKDD